MNCYTKNDLNNLLQLVTNSNLAGSPALTNYLIRNKPKKYFENIINNRAAVMEKYLKDGGNDPLNPLNLTAHGLFFLIEPCNNFSGFFGDTQLFVPINFFLKQNLMIYFADFYCLGGSVHYVTLVLCKKDSEHQIFCKENLIQLDFRKNIFFEIQNKKAISYSSKKFVIEVFYMHNVDLVVVFKEGGFFVTNIKIKGRGSSKKEGKPKKNSCKKCNLPIATTKKRRSYNLSSRFNPTFKFSAFHFSKEPYAKYAYNQYFENNKNFFMERSGFFHSKKSLHSMFSHLKLK